MEQPAARLCCSGVSVRVNLRRCCTFVFGSCSTIIHDAGGRVPVGKPPLVRVAGRLVLWEPSLLLERRHGSGLFSGVGIEWVLLLIPLWPPRIANRVVTRRSGLWRRCRQRGVPCPGPSWSRPGPAGRARPWPTVRKRALNVWQDALQSAALALARSAGDTGGPPNMSGSWYLQRSPGRRGQSRHVTLWGKSPRSTSTTSAKPEPPGRCLRRPVRDHARP